MIVSTRAHLRRPVSPCTGLQVLARLRTRPGSRFGPVVCPWLGGANGSGVRMKLEYKAESSRSLGSGLIDVACFPALGGVFAELMTRNLLLMGITIGVDAFTGASRGLPERNLAVLYRRLGGRNHGERNPPVGVRIIGTR